MERTQASWTRTRRTREARAWVAAVALVCAGTVSGAPEEHGHESRRAYFHLYAAQWSRTRLNQIVRLQLDWDDSHLASIALGRPFQDLGPRSRLEWELQAVQHRGAQDHSEVNAVVSIRWRDLPWDRLARSTLAFGTGPSYAFSVPATEQGGDDESTHLLQYVMVEMTAALPRTRDWTLFLRAHHRSGTFGLVADSGSSNFVGFGIRRHF